MEGEAAVLLPTRSLLRGGLGLLDLCERRAMVLSAQPDTPSPLPLLLFVFIGSGLQHGFIAPVFKSHHSQKMSTMQPANTLSVEEGRGWFGDWGPGMAFRNCSAAAPLHSVKHAVYLLSFLCPSALAQGVGNEKSAVETLGLPHRVTVSRHTCDEVMSMDLLVDGGSATIRVEALPLLMLLVCFWIPWHHHSHLVCGSTVTAMTTMLGTINFLDRQRQEDGLKENVTALGKIPWPFIANWCGEWRNCFTGQIWV